MGGVALGRTGGSRHLGGVAVSQLGDGLRVGVGTLGAGIRLGARGGTGGRLGDLGGIAVARGGLVGVLVGVGAPAAGPGGIALGRTGGGSHLGLIAMAQLGDGLGPGGGAQGALEGLGARGGTGGRLGHGPGVPQVAPGAAAAPVAAVQRPGALAGGGDRQVPGLVPFVVPVVVRVAAVHAAEDHTGIARGHGYLIISVAVRPGHADPFLSVPEEIGSETCPVHQPFAVWLQEQGSRCGRVHMTVIVSVMARSRYHAEDHGDHQQDTEEFVHPS